MISLVMRSIKEFICIDFATWCRKYANMPRQSIETTTPIPEENIRVPEALSFKRKSETIEYTKEPMKNPRILNVTLFSRKSCRTRGENCPEYIVSTTIIVEKVIVVIVRSEPVKTEKSVFPSSTDVKR